jgi:hypothetical protein
MQSSLIGTSEEGPALQKDIDIQKWRRETQWVIRPLFGRDAHTRRLLDEVFDQDSTAVAVQSFGSRDYAFIATAPNTNPTHLSFLFDQLVEKYNHQLKEHLKPAGHRQPENQQDVIPMHAPAE